MNFILFSTATSHMLVNTLWLKMVKCRVLLIVFIPYFGPRMNALHFWGKCKSEK